MRPLLIVAFCSCSSPPDPTKAIDSVDGSAGNEIRIENLRRGDAEWVLSQPSRPEQHDVEGFVSEPSVLAGESFTLYVHVAVPTQVRWRIYRLGWYDGLGARRVADWSPRVPAAPQPMPLPDPVTHLVECQWSPTATVAVDAGWLSGVYLIKLQAGTGYESYVPFVVRSERPSDLLFALALTTYQAYNMWGDWDLYGHRTPDNTLDGAVTAARVSLDRPYGLAQAGQQFYDTYGTGHLLLWDIYLLEWLESMGYDVTYATSFDLEADPTLPLSHQLFISGPHDEYWSPTMRDGIEEARDEGVSLAFLGANAAYWKIRIEPSTSGVPRRIVTCYKDNPDPLDGTPDSTTVLWRTVGRPENALVGIMYGYEDDIAPQPFVPFERGHWAFAGTGLEYDGTIPGVVGYEYDMVDDNGESPPGLHVLGHSPTEPGMCGDATIYFASSGAQVFAAGSIFWSWGLARQGIADARLQALMRNLIDNALSHQYGPADSADETPPLPPCP